MKELIFRTLLGSLLIFTSCQSTIDKPILLKLNKELMLKPNSIKLTSDSLSYQLGQIPNLNVHLINTANDTINFITSLDGSADSSRFPYTGFIISRNDTLVGKTEKITKCGNLDGINKQALFTLYPNQKLDITENTIYVYQDFKVKAPETWNKKGTYKVKYYYSNDNDSLSNWLGWNSDFRFLSLEQDKKDSLTNYYYSLFKKTPWYERTACMYYF